MDDNQKIIDPGFGAVTEREALMIRACRAAMASREPVHPASWNKPFGQMTDQELRELIAWHETGKKQ